MVVYKTKLINCNHHIYTQHTLGIPVGQIYSMAMAFFLKTDVLKLDFLKRAFYMSFITCFRCEKNVFLIFIFLNKNS